MAQQDKANQPNHTGEEKVGKATVCYWWVFYHLPTGPWMLEGKGNSDDGVEKLKETSDGKKDSKKKTFHRVRVWADMNSNVVVITIRGPIMRRKLGAISTAQCILRAG